MQLLLRRPLESNFPEQLLEVKMHSLSIKDAALQRLLLPYEIATEINFAIDQIENVGHILRLETWMVSTIPINIGGVHLEISGLCDADDGLFVM